MTARTSLRWWVWLGGLGAVMAAIVGCGGKKLPPAAPPTAPDLVATVGDETITRADFEAEAKRRAVPLRDASARAALLGEMVRDLRLLQVAHAKGYDRDPAIVRQHNALLIDRARQDFGFGTEPDPSVNQQEIQAYYDAHQAEYVVPARVRAAMIFVATPPGLNAEALAAKRHKIDEALAAISAAHLPLTVDFGGLAITFSEDQNTRYIGGDLGYQVAGLTSFAPDPAASAALFALTAPGQLSQIVVGKEGLYLFKVLECAPAGRQPLARVRERIGTLVLAEEQRERTKKMEAALGTVAADVHPENLAAFDAAPAVPQESTASQLPPIPRSTDAKLP